MVLQMSRRDIAVVELSSYQLERCITFRPDVAIITNITPDHLDRYGHDMQHYAEAKFRIFMNQTLHDTLIYNNDDPLLRDRFSGDSGRFPFRICSFGMEPVSADDIGRCMVCLKDDTVVVLQGSDEEPVLLISDVLNNSFRGRHNSSNVLAAVAAAKALGIGSDPVRSALHNFRGVEHRQEFIVSINGADWINDSKATNINAMRQAIEAVPGTAVLIAGGRDKGNDYSSVAELVRNKVSLLIAIGESQKKIASFFEGIVPLEVAGTLEQAVVIASNAARPGQSVLFSPGCASFDMFANFEERGRHFKQCVYNLQ